MKNNQKQQSSLPQLDTWEKGYRLRNGKYTIEKELGRGGFGITYLAKDKKGNAVVIKTPTKQQIESAEEVAGFWENFAQEAVKLAQCSRRNTHIVELHEVVRERELPCLVMEYIEGETLSSLVKQGVLSEAKATRYIAQIGSALAEMHSQNLLHRDVKPQNIMLRADGRGAVLIDFGIAQKFISGRTQTIIPALTPGYGPPEQYQWRGKQGAYTDVYALAGTLYFALTGKVPLPAHERIEQRSLEPPNKINPKISKRVNDAILKGMELEPRVRPQSIEDWLKLFLTKSDLEKTRKIRLRSAGEEETKNLKEKTTIKLKEPTPFPQIREYPEGPVGLNSPFYIERPNVDSLGYQTILQPGALIRIKAPKQMGKTSLLNRILAHAAAHNCATVYLDLGSVERKILTNLDKFLRWLCLMVGKKQKVENQLLEYWDTEILGSNDNCTAYFEEYLLPEINRPLVLGLDQVDRVFPWAEVVEDFFGMLRSWHERSKTAQIWQQMRLILAHSTEVYISLDMHQSPFNAGVALELLEFEREQLFHLAEVYQLDWNNSQIEQLENMVGGHPYLVRLAMYKVSSQQVNLEQLLKAAPTQAGIYSKHLMQHLKTLRQASQLAEALKQVVNSSTPVELDPMDIYDLHSMGLIQRQENHVKPRCKLYRDYFSRVL